MPCCGHRCGLSQRLVPKACAMGLSVAVTCALAMALAPAKAQGIAMVCVIGIGMPNGLHNGIALAWDIRQRQDLRTIPYDKGLVMGQ